MDFKARLTIREVVLGLLLVVILVLTFGGDHSGSKHSLAWSLAYVVAIVAPFWWEKKGMAVGLCLAAVLLAQSVLQCVHWSFMIEVARVASLVLVSVLTYKLAVECRVAARRGLHDVVDPSGEGFVIVDMGGIVVFANPVAEKLYGVEPGELERTVFGHPLSDSPTDMEFCNKKGECLTVEIQTTEAEWEGEDARLVSLEDVTERRKIDKMKTDFISLVSHQLKTPIAQVKGYAENMLDGVVGEFTPRQREYLEDILQITLRNYMLVSELLSVSQIERGIMSMDVRPLDLFGIVRCVADSFAECAELHGLVIHMEGSDEAIEVLSDERNLREALGNVVDNAIKYVESGPITIRIESEPTDGIATIQVSDTGSGISAEDMETLFLRDVSLGKEPTAQKGFGLGLYLSRQLMELQNSSLEASSIEGQGTVFTFRIPLTEGNDDE